MAVTGVGWCFDSGHLLIGGVDPSDFVRRHGDRIVHVHLKDVDAALAARVRDGELSLLQATQAGLFKPLGAGDVDIAQVMELLDAHGYERWFVLEQDTAITGPEPPVGSGPILDVRQSVEFLDTAGSDSGGGSPHDETSTHAARRRGARCSLQACGGSDDDTSRPGGEDPSSSPRRRT